MRQHRVNQYNLQKICQQDIPEIHILTISHIKFESKKRKSMINSNVSYVIYHFLVI